MSVPLSNTEYRHISWDSEESLLAYAKKLEGHTFREVLDLGIAPDDVKRDYGSRRYKGGMGTLIEERYFGYRANSDDRPDFPDAGVELKSTCYDVLKDGTESAGERLVLTMVPFDREISDSLGGSHLWGKLRRILLVYYRRDKAVEPYDQEIEYVALFTPPAEDMPILEEDYRAIRDLVQAGRAEELSEGMTRYLGACTKGATAATMWAEQFYPPHAMAKRRAFCLKRQYMDYILKHYLIGDADAGEAIVKDPAALSASGFDAYVLSLLEPYVGMTDREIARTVGVPYTGNKAQWSTLTWHMLGLSDGRAEEFEKAGINARTVRVEGNRKVRESLSLPPFRFKELAAEEDFYESELCRYFEETRFFFVAFDDDGAGYRLRGGRFWSMPQADVDGPLRECWEHTRDILRRGVRFTEMQGRAGGVTVRNDLPGASDNPVAHVRPHASRAAYLLADGTEIGDIRKDGDELPDGQWMTKQSFWLNSGYTYEIVRGI